VVGVAAVRGTARSRPCYATGVFAGGKPTRRLWIAALSLSVVCVGGLAYALYAEWNTEPTRGVEPAQRAASGGGGFSIGLVIGIAAGVVLGTLIATRKRS
jgi:hypothetical protein